MKRIEVLICCALVSLLLIPAAVRAQSDPWPVESFFDVFTELTTNQPGAEPIKLIVQTDPPPVGDPVPTEEITLAYTQVDWSTGLPSVRMQASDSGGGGGLYGIDSFFDVFYEGVTPGIDFPAESFFDVFVEVTPPAGKPSAGRTLPAPPEVFHIDSFFDVFFDVTVPDIDPLYDRMRHHIHGQLAPGLKFNNVGVNPGQPFVDSFFDVFFDITVTDVGQIPAAGPIMTMQMRGGLLPEPGALGLFAAATAILLKRRRKP